MTEPIISRQRIAELAYQAAQDIDAGKQAPNPYPVGTQAHEFWQLSLYRSQMELNGEVSA